MIDQTKRVKLLTYTIQEGEQPSTDRTKTKTGLNVDAIGIFLRKYKGSKLVREEMANPTRPITRKEREEVTIYPFKVWFRS